MSDFAEQLRARKSPCPFWPGDSEKAWDRAWESAIWAASRLVEEHYTPKIPDGWLVVSVVWSDLLQIQRVTLRNDTLHQFANGAGRSFQEAVEDALNPETEVSDTITRLMLEDQAREIEVPNGE